MKGKLLLEQQVMLLKEGVEVWVEDRDKIFSSKVHISKNNVLVDESGAFWRKNSNSINVYEWLIEKSSNVSVIREVAPIQKIEFSSRFGVPMSFKNGTNDVQLSVGDGTWILSNETIFEVHKLLGEMLGVTK